MLFSLLKAPIYSSILVTMNTLTVYSQLTRYTNMRQVINRNGDHRPIFLRLDHDSKFPSVHEIWDFILFICFGEPPIMEES